MNLYRSLFRKYHAQYSRLLFKCHIPIHRIFSFECNLKLYRQQALAADAAAQHQGTNNSLLRSHCKGKYIKRTIFSLGYVC